MATLGQSSRRNGAISEEEVERWRREELERSLSRVPPRRAGFTTLSDVPIRDVYTSSDVAEVDERTDLALPGQYPYTRGVHASMYRGRPWTIRQVAGFGQGEDTNRRYKYLLEHGETGLSTDFDLPTLLGHDSDHPVFNREVAPAVAAAVSAEARSSGLSREFSDLIDPLHVTRATGDLAP